MIFLKALLETKEAKEVIGAGLLRLIETNSLDEGISTLIEQGNKNGSWPLAKLAFILDLFGVLGNRD